MAKKIIWSKLAHNDRLEILKYWYHRNDSAEYSIKLNNAINYAVSFLDGAGLVD
jgi:hypothetical protein